MKNGQQICMIAFSTSIEMFAARELEDPTQLDSMLKFLYSMVPELPFEVIFDDGEGNIIDRFGKPE